MMNNTNSDETFKKLEKEYQDIQQIMLLQDIINSYENNWPNYEAYFEDKNREVENANKFEQCTFTLRVKPIILEADQFKFVHELGIIKRHRNLEKVLKNEKTND